MPASSRTRASGGSRRRTGTGGGRPAGGVDHVFDQRAHESGGHGVPGGGAEQIEGASLSQEGGRIELLARFGAHRGQDLRVGQSREGVGNDTPDAVADLGVATDDRLEGDRGQIGPTCLQDGDGLGGQVGGQTPPVEVGGGPVAEGGGVEEAADHVPGPVAPEGVVLCRSSRVRYQAGGPGHGRLDSLAAAGRRPPGGRGDARGQTLRVEHRDRAELGPGLHGDGQVVGPGGGGDDRTAMVEDARDDQMEPFAGPRRADHDGGVLDAGPHVRALAAPHPMTDIGGCRLPQRRTQDRCRWRTAGARRRAVRTCFRSASPASRSCGLVCGCRRAERRTRQPTHTSSQGGRRVHGGDGPVDGHRADGDTPRFGRVAPMGQRGQAGELVVGW